MIKNKDILLVDDVSTSCATLRECAKILKRNGAKKVYGVTFAREL
jgi:predicted amidophosphoribosyltransferase